MSVLSTDTKDPFHFLFTDPMDRPKSPYGDPFTPSSGSHHYDSPQISTLRLEDYPT